MSFYNTVLVLSFLLLTVSVPESIPEISEPESYVRLLPPDPPIINFNEQYSLRLAFKIEEGYHIMANQGDQSNLLYTRLELSGNEEVQLGEFEFPFPENFFLEGFPEFIPVFEDTLQIKVPVSLKGTTEKGAHRLYGTLFYQACDDRKCFFPKELSFLLDLNIKGS